MTLTDLVRLHSGKEVFRGINILEYEIREGYASHIEYKFMSWANVVRMGRSWERLNSYARQITERALRN